MLGGMHAVRACFRRSTKAPAVCLFFFYLSALNSLLKTRRCCSSACWVALNYEHALHCRPPGARNAIRHQQQQQRQCSTWLRTMNIRFQFSCWRLLTTAQYAAPFTVPPTSAVISWMQIIFAVKLTKFVPAACIFRTFSCPKCVAAFQLSPSPH